MKAQFETDILIEGVTKFFNTGLGAKKIGVNELHLQVPKGQVVGLLGPNGSGKSTTIKMILGFLKPNKGKIFVCGHEVPSKVTRSFIGYLPENPRFPKFLSGRSLLRFYGSLLSLSGAELEKRVEFLLELVNLKSASQEKVQGYSKGMTQRLAIAQALLNEPRLLIFDEPMSGLDPMGRRDIRSLIARIHRELPNATIFFSSHILEDVEQLCSMVALLKKGKLQKFCAIEELLKEDGHRFDVSIRTPNLESRSFSNTNDLLQFLNESNKKGYLISQISSVRNSLEEALFRDDKPAQNSSPSQQEISP
jgi:ABC-2 type transport system ATP-binding protein